MTTPIPRLPPPPERDELLALPRTLALCLWTEAYLRGDCGPDDALDAGTGTGHRAVQQLGLDLFEWMTAVHRLPLPRIHPVLPAPGRIAGLVGPPPAVAAAIQAEQAIVVSAAGLAEHTLVPTVEVIGSSGAEGVVVRWETFPAPGTALPPPSEGSGARASFLGALQRAASSAQQLDIVPEEAVPLAQLPASWTAIVPPRHLAPPQLHLLTLASRTLLLTDAELADQGERPGVVGLAAATSRTAVLRELRDAAREAVVEVAGAAGPS